MNAPLILGFGASAVDEIVYVDGRLDAGKGRIVRRERAFGGNIATALVAVAKLGGRAAFVGWLADGDDPATVEMERAGVDVSSAPRRPDASPIRSTIVVDPEGDRFIAYDDDGPRGTADDLPDAVLARGRVLLVDGYAARTATVIERAVDLGLAVVADLEWYAEGGTERLIGLAGHLVLPMGFARALTRQSDAASVLSSLWTEERAAVVLTDGGRGAYIRSRGEPTLWHMPAHPVLPVDTTGAGDCFHGAYALAIAEGASPIDAVLFATAASAIAVTGHGGRGALPTRDQCRALMGGSGAPSPVPLVTI